MNTILNFGEKIEESKKMNELDNQRKVELNEVLEYLESQLDDNLWSNKTNGLAINYAKHLGEIYGDNWYTGILKRSDFLNICLPEHNHLNESDRVLFPDNTKVLDAVNKIRKLDISGSKACLKHINYIKDKIKEEGFISKLVLVVINGELKHVDGLHRILALGLLIDEGFDYPKFDVYLCDNTKCV